MGDGHKVMLTVSIANLATMIFLCAGVDSAPAEDHDMTLFFAMGFFSASVLTLVIGLVTLVTLSAIDKARGDK